MAASHFVSAQIYRKILAQMCIWRLEPEVGKRKVALLKMGQLDP